jgi:hypothetical protein
LPGEIHLKMQILPSWGEPPRDVGKGKQPEPVAEWTSRR